MVVAAHKRIGLMGANIDQQFLAAGSWTRSESTWSMSCSEGTVGWFDQLPKRIELEQIGLSQTDGVTHLEYRVLSNARNAPSG